MLVFWNEEHGKPATDIKKTFLNDECGDTSDKAKDIRQCGLHVLTIFK